MKRGTCPKCDSDDVYFKEYALNIVNLDGKNVPYIDYVCTSCGYFETYITDKNALSKIAGRAEKLGIGRNRNRIRLSRRNHVPKNTCHDFRHSDSSDPCLPCDPFRAAANDCSQRRQRKTGAHRPGTFAWLSEPGRDFACDPGSPGNHLSDHQGRVEQHSGSGRHSVRGSDGWRGHLIFGHDRFYPNRWDPIIQELVMEDESS
jgi:hypothetical protein